MRSLSYTPDGADAFDDPEAAIRAPGTTWVCASGDRAELDRTAERFGIHPLHVEDVVNDVRPKTEVFDEYTFFLAKAARFRVGETTFLEEIRTDPVGVFVGEGWLVTLTTSEVSAVSRVWDRVAGAERRALARGPDFVGYLVLDRIVDDYFALLDEVEDDIESVEELVIEAPDPETLAAINDLRRELLSIRRVVWPTRDAANALYRGDANHVAEATEKYYRDVYDHLVQVVELTETYRDLTSGARDIYLNTVSQSTNEVMRKLTVVSAVLLPLTFVAGLFGMNFATMPELGWPYAYPAVLVGMAGVAAVLVAYFSREEWL
ncbi:magnesium and cobalt transport protein CorA [Candidatus Halobonum tyrrellensis G22]|uniref:Magnesium transport protein CorA n=2 Tax=Candidatus Halobonum TaxID=1431544 RepID=V4HER0_9EURY|nr:magnesium and cobalt transport protein CorA [Candidatus Halobonum tyrrellensis G22]